MRKMCISTMLAVFISGCALTPKSNYFHTPPPPLYENYCNQDICNTNQYADDLNWYMIFLLTYTKAFNEYAKSNGWNPPNSQPVCRLVKWPKLSKFPDFDPKNYNHNIKDFEWMLTQYIKQIKRIYNTQRDNVEDLEYVQKTLCTY